MRSAERRDAVGGAEAEPDTAAGEVEEMQCGANRGRRVNDLRACEVATHQARGHLVSHPDTLLMARLSTLILVVAAHVAALNPSDRARPAVSSRRAQFPAPKPELVASTSTGLQLSLIHI